jgi:small subunit ribosomal protein S6
LRSYEFMYIVSPEVEHEDLENVTARIGQMIAERGGEVLRLESWGRRRLAYPIRRFREGYYIVAHIQLEPAAISDLQARLGLAEEVIRYLLVKADEIPAAVAPAVPPEEAAIPEESDEEDEEKPAQEPAEELTEPEAPTQEETEDSEQ